MRAKFIYEILSSEIVGLEEFLNNIVDHYPHTKYYRKDIEDFIVKSGCKKIQIERLNDTIGGLSLSDRVVINDLCFYQPFSIFLYIIFHEIAHQYQYKKYGKKKMYEFYLGDFPIEQLAKFMQHVELVADEFAIRKCRELAKIGILNLRFISKSIYKYVPLDHFKDLISEIRIDVQKESITDPRKISEFLYNWLKNKSINVELDKNVNESIKHLKPKSEEEIRSCLKNLSPEEKLETGAIEGLFWLVKDALDAGANVHARDDWALRWASENGHVEVVKVLLDAGANVHAEDDWALRWASYNGHVEVVKVLLDAGADVHTYNDRALRWASDKGHVEVVKVLFDAGANVHAKDDYALRWASANGCAEVVKLLKQYSKKKKKVSENLSESIKHLKPRS